MKKQSKVCLLLFMIMNIVVLQASSFQIAIPQDLVKKNATLLLLVSDSKGQQFLRKYQLGKTRTNTITQEELEIATENSEISDGLIEILPNNFNLSEISSEESVVVCFVLDSDFQVLRVMVLKDSLLEDNPFDILSLPLSKELDFDQFHEDIQDIDELEKLTKGLENSDLSGLNQQSDSTWFEQYMLYAKIFTTMQYHKVKKAFSSNWWN